MPDRSRPGSTTIAHPLKDSRVGAIVCFWSENNHQTPYRRNDNRNMDVCSLHVCGKVQELTHELKRYRWDILSLAEVRWTGFGKKNYHG